MLDGFWRRHGADTVSDRGTFLRADKSTGYKFDVFHSLRFVFADCVCRKGTYRFQKGHTDDLGRHYRCCNRISGFAEDSDGISFKTFRWICCFVRSKTDSEYKKKRIRKVFCVTKKKPFCGEQYSSCQKLIANIKRHKE